MRGGAAASGGDAQHALRVEAGRVGGGQLVGQQHARLDGRLRAAGAREIGQHLPPHVLDVGRTRPEERVVQGAILGRDPLE